MTEKKYTDRLKEQIETVAQAGTLAVGGLTIRPNIVLMENVTIWFDTGEVDIKDPEKLTESARAFFAEARVQGRSFHEHFQALKDENERIKTDHEHLTNVLRNHATQPIVFFEDDGQTPRRLEWRATSFGTGLVAGKYVATDPFSMTATMERLSLLERIADRLLTIQAQHPNLLNGFDLDHELAELKLHREIERDAAQTGDKA